MYNVWFYLHIRFQEIVPLSAGNVLGSENSKISRKWNAMIRETLNKSSSRARPGQSSMESHSKEHFRCIVSKQMVGLFISVWIRSNLCEFVSHPSVSCVGCGIMGCLGNKVCVNHSSIMYIVHNKTNPCLTGHYRHHLWDEDFMLFDIYLIDADIIRWSVINSFSKSWLHRVRCRLDFCCVKRACALFVVI